jgi:hypothetical protein
MNIFELSINLLELSPIPSSIQWMIIHSLIGHGTPSTNAIKKSNVHIGADNEIPIRVVALYGLNECRYTMYYMEGAIVICYKNASYHSRMALFELHTIYLLNKKKQTQYVVTKLRDISNSLKEHTKNRLEMVCSEEPKK